MRTGYRLRPIGEPAAPGQPTMWSMDVASWIHHPSGDEPVAPGPVQITGFAFGGAGGIRRVQVSLDGGETWQRARFVGPDLGPYAWRPFVLPVTLEAGTYTLASVAVDRSGGVQAEGAGGERAGLRQHKLARLCRHGHGRLKFKREALLERRRPAFRQDELVPRGKQRKIGVR